MPRAETPVLLLLLRRRQRSEAPDPDSLPPGIVNLHQPTPESAGQPAQDRVEVATMQGWAYQNHPLGLYA